MSAKGCNISNVHSSQEWQAAEHFDISPKPHTH